MKLVTVHTLRREVSTVLSMVSRGQKMITTTRGKPQAVLMRLTEANLEDVVLTRPSFLREIQAARRGHAARAGVSREGARRRIRRERRDRT